MTTPNEPTKSDDLYFSDHESGAEMARLLDQDRIMTQCMGGLLVEQTDLSGIRRILDIGCGPGGWALEVAYAYPDKEIVGIDISQQMIDYASAQARLRSLSNATFLVMNALQSLDFPADSFDLVNMRLFGFIPPTAWPQFFQGCSRVLRSGGIMRWTECEVVTSNKPAVEKLWSMFALALNRAGQSFSPDGRLFGLTAVMGSLLRQAGFRNVQLKPSVFDGSAGTELHAGFCQDMRFSFKLLQPFFISVGVTTQEEIDLLYEQMLVEILAEDFCALQYLLTAWGEKA